MVSSALCSLRCSVCCSLFIALFALYWLFSVRCPVRSSLRCSLFVALFGVLFGVHCAAHGDVHRWLCPIWIGPQRAVKVSAAGETDDPISRCTLTWASRRVALQLQLTQPRRLPSAPPVALCCWSWCWPHVEASASDGAAGFGPFRLIVASGVLWPGWPCSALPWPLELPSAAARCTRHARRIPRTWRTASTAPPRLRRRALGSGTPRPAAQTVAADETTWPQSTATTDGSAAHLEPSRLGATLQAHAAPVPACPPVQGWRSVVRGRRLSVQGRWSAMQGWWSAVQGWWSAVQGRRSAVQVF